VPPCTFVACSATTIAIPFANLRDERGLFTARAIEGQATVARTVRQESLGAEEVMMDH
jgi:hypothetical protein